MFLRLLTTDGRDLTESLTDLTVHAVGLPKKKGKSNSHVPLEYIRSILYFDCSCDEFTIYFINTYSSSLVAKSRYLVRVKSVGIYSKQGFTDMRHHSKSNKFQLRAQRVIQAHASNLIVHH